MIRDGGAVGNTAPRVELVVRSCRRRLAAPLTHTGSTAHRAIWPYVARPFVVSLAFFGQCAHHGAIRQGGAGTLGFPKARRQHTVATTVAQANGESDPSGRRGRARKGVSVTVRSIPRRGVALASALLLVSSFVGLSAASASSMPSGQRTVGNSTFSTASGTFTGGGGVVEPAYDDANGTLVYLLTPTNAKTHPNAHNVAPLYLPVYPVGSGIDPASLNCAHMSADNCPDHGPGVAGAAMGISAQRGFGSVYAGGVLGHDHLVGIASTGGDFNVIWEPTLILFTNAAAARTHITTLAQINAALNPPSGPPQAIEVPLPQLDFSCASVSAAVYNRGTPAATVVGP